MMLVLLFSITPKKFLHDLIADHTDTVSLAVNDGHDHIDHHGFNCDCDNLVATSPFVSHALLPELIALHSYSISFASYISASKAVDITPSFLRGPPTSI